MNPAQPAIQSLRRARRRWPARLARSNGFAWTVSIGAHLAVFAVVYPMVFSDEIQPRRVISPEARLAPVEEASSEQPPATIRINRQQVPVPEALPDESLIAAEQLPPSLIDEHVLPAPQLPAEGTSVLTDAGSPAAAGPPGPVSTFFGTAGNAYRVAYVVDVSRSIADFLPELATEISRSVKRLIPTQQFNIILTYGGQVHEFRTGRLVWANARQKQAAETFLSGIAPDLNAKPVEAMEQAFAARPELIYFLSDGDYEWDVIKEGGRTSLEKRLDELNHDRSVRITVLGFGPAPGPRSLLERIAREHGGNYRTVVIK